MECELSVRRIFGKLPDERRRRRPRESIVAQGLHPHPGTATHGCGVDDPDGLEGDAVSWDGAESDDDNHSDGWPAEQALDEDIDEDIDDEGNEQDAPSESEGGMSTTPDRPRQVVGDSPRDHGEEMRAGGLEDKENEDLQRHLASIGCPVVGASVKVDRASEVWRCPGESEDENPPELVGSSSDEEVWHDDHDVSRRSLCRGEGEGVSGNEGHSWDPVAWALNTSRGHMLEDPSRY